MASKSKETTQILNSEVGMGIYSILHAPTGHRYIGCAVSPKRRYQNHLKLLKRGLHHNRNLQRLFNEHAGTGFEFSVIEKVEKRENLMKREQYWVDHYWGQAPDLVMNIPTHFRIRIKPNGFGSRFLAAFEDKAWSRREIALALNVSPASVTEYIRGRVPNARMLQRIMELTGVSLDWLLLEVGAKYLRPDQLDRNVLLIHLSPALREAVETVAALDGLSVEEYIYRTLLGWAIGQRHLIEPERYRRLLFEFLELPQPKRAQTRPGRRRANE